MVALFSKYIRWKGICWYRSNTIWVLRICETATATPWDPDKMAAILQKTLLIIFLYDNGSIFIKIPLVFISTGVINSKPSLFRIMAWHRIGGKPSSEQMMVQFTDVYMHHPASINWGWRYQFHTAFILSSIQNPGPKVTIGVRTPSAYWTCDVPMTTFTWYQITLAWSPHYDLDVYVNGVLNFHVTPRGTGNFDSTRVHHFVVGSSSSLGGLGQPHTLPVVDIDELKYWTQKLSGRDIWCLHNEVVVFH